jgi:hypothetical protein
MENGPGDWEQMFGDNLPLPPPPALPPAANENDGAGVGQAHMEIDFWPPAPPPAAAGAGAGQVAMNVHPAQLQVHDVANPTVSRFKATDSARDAIRHSANQRGAAAAPSYVAEGVIPVLGDQGEIEADCSLEFWSQFLATDTNDACHDSSPRQGRAIQAAATPTERLPSSAIPTSDRQSAAPAQNSEGTVNPDILCRLRQILLQATQTAKYSGNWRHEANKASEDAGKAVWEAVMAARDGDTGANRGADNRQGILLPSSDASGETSR